VSKVSTFGATFSHLTHFSSFREKSDAKTKVKKKKDKEFNYVTTVLPSSEDTFEQVSKDEVIISVAIYHPKKQIKNQV